LDSDDEDQPATAPLPPIAKKSPVDNTHDTSVDEKPKEIESTSQKEPSSLSLLDDFDDLDPDLASSLMESLPDPSLQNTSIDPLPANKIALKFQMRLYPVIETPLPPAMQVLIKVLKVYVLDVSTRCIDRASPAHQWFSIFRLTFSIARSSRTSHQCICPPQEVGGEQLSIYLQ
jgi:hypothetical protein